MSTGKKVWVKLKGRHTDDLKVSVFKVRFWRIKV